MDHRRIIAALTGASGAIYCRRLVDVLSEREDVEVHLLASETGLRVAAHELGVALPDVRRAAEVFAAAGAAERVVAHADDFFAPVASGSFRFDAMVVVPCSGGRLASLAGGVCRDLIDRVCEVTLKEKRKLIVVPRETPLNAIHLANLMRLAEAGAVILPAMPGFYHRPERVEDLVDFVVARILDQLGLGQDLVQPWGEK